VRVECLIVQTVFIDPPLPQQLDTPSF